MSFRRGAGLAKFSSCYVLRKNTRLINGQCIFNLFENVFAFTVCVSNAS